LHVVLDNRHLYLEGMRTTVVLTVVSFAIAVVIGTVVAGFRVSPVRPLRLAGAGFTETFRNTPLVVLFILFAHGLTKAGVRYSLFITAIIVLSLYTSAFVAETLRAGMNAVAQGQAEAARSLGLTFPQVLFGVVLPQAFRTVAAPLGSLFIALIKNSAIASVISVADLAFVADDVANRSTQPIPALMGAAVAYLMLAVPAGLALRVVERRVAIKR